MFKVFLASVLLGPVVLRGGYVVFVRSRWGLLAFPLSYASVFKVLVFGVYRVLDVFLVGSRFLGVGAGVGDSCFYALRRGARSVVCVEPDAVMARFLRFNLAVNRLRGDVVEACVGGTCFMVDWGSGSVSRVCGVGVGWDELLPLGFDVVKVDCEGCEWTLESRHIEKAKVWLVEVTGPLERFLRRVPPRYKVFLVSRGVNSSSLMESSLVLVVDPRWIRGLQRTPRA